VTRLRRLSLPLVVGVLIGLACSVGGVFELVDRTSGPRATATVSRCEESGIYRARSTHCTGTWIVGGKLVGGNGHVVVGPIDGADKSDVGKKIDVRLSGGEAHTTSLALPIVLIAFGLLLVIPGGVALSKDWRGV
jgi:hypothetical protein